MRSSDIICSSIVALFAVGSLTSQSLTRFEGSTPQSLSVRVLSESQPTSPGNVILQGIEILPIEMTGHTVGQDLQPGVSRVATRNGFARIDLPDGGRVFRYRRNGGAAWGYLHVNAAGAAQVVLELPGIAGTTNPFADRIAVSASGHRAVLALAAGGLYVVRLDGGVFASSNSAARFVPTITAVLPPSVMVGRTHVFYETGGPSRLWRVAMADGGAPTEHTPPRAPTDTLRVELAMSGDGSKIAFLSGPRNRWSIYLLGETGTWRTLPTAPAKYEEPGYLPEGSGHANFLLNQDGSRLFYLDSTISDETFLMDTTGVLPTLHITEDTVFQPTIGVHILPTFIAGSLVVAIGNTINGFHLMDWFKADMTPAGGTVTNLTGTGSMLKPYPVGALHPTQGAMVGTTLLTTNQTAGTQTLRAIQPATGQSAVMMTDLESVPVAGSTINGAVPDVIVNGTSTSLLSGTSGSMVGTLPTGMFLTPPAAGSAYSATFVNLTPSLGMVTLYSPNGDLAAMPLESTVQQVVQTKTGAIVVQGATTKLFAPGVQAQLAVPATPVAAIVSGAGG